MTGTEFNFKKCKDSFVYDMKKKDFIHKPNKSNRKFNIASVVKVLTYIFVEDLIHSQKLTLTEKLKV